MEQFSVPLSVKTIVFEDVWQGKAVGEIGNLGKEASNEEGDGAGQAAPATDGNAATKKDDGKTKGAKSKKEAKAKKGAKD
eukprot:4641851-Lingulodinium_polyedra.AAC.1